MSAAPSTSRRRRRRSLVITRTVVKDEFTYYRRGKKITSTVEIERINALAIPPAWSDVLIATSARAKILAIGYDAAGREQAIYSQAFRDQQEQKKYVRLLHFAESLPQLRQRVDRDLRRRGLPRDKVVACVIRLMDSQYFRVGSPQYAAEHGSYGITTLQDEHVHANGSSVDFDFIGKSGQRQKVKAKDRRAARVVSQLKELQGSEVFRFLDDGGSVRKVNASHINNYVRKHTGGGDFSAKDFRTWGGTLLASTGVFAAEDTSWETKTSREKAMREVVKEVAGRLGNTPAVTRSSYIAPQVFSLIQQQEQLSDIRKLRESMAEQEFFSVDEQCVVQILQLELSDELAEAEAQAA